MLKRSAEIDIVSAKDPMRKPLRDFFLFLFELRR